MRSSSSPNVIAYAVTQPLSNICPIPYFYLPSISKETVNINYELLLNTLSKPNKTKILKQWFNYENEFKNLPFIQKLVNQSTQEEEELRDLKIQEESELIKMPASVVSSGLPEELETENKKQEEDRFSKLLQNVKELYKSYSNPTLNIRRYKSVSQYVYSQMLLNPCNKNIISLKELHTINFKLYNKLKGNEIHGVIEQTLLKAYNTKLSLPRFKKQLIETKKEKIEYQDIKSLPILQTEYPIQSLIQKNIEQYRSYLLKNIKIDEQLFYKIYIIYQYLDQYVRKIILTEDRTQNIPILNMTLNTIQFIKQLPFDNTTIQSMINIIIYITSITLLNQYSFSKLYDWITSKLEIVHSLNLEYVISEMKSEKFENLRSSLISHSDNYTKDIIERRYKTLICNIFNNLLPNKSNLELILYIQEYFQQHNQPSSIIKECVPFYKSLDMNPILRRNLKKRLTQFLPFINEKNIEKYKQCINFFYDQIYTFICEMNMTSYTLNFSINQKVIYHVEEKKHYPTNINSLKEEDYTLKKQNLETEIKNLKVREQFYNQQRLQALSTREATTKKELLQSLQEDKSIKSREELESEQSLENIEQKIKYKTNIVKQIIKKQETIKKSLQIKDNTHFLSPLHEYKFEIGGVVYTTILEYVYTVLISCFTISIPTLLDAHQLVKINVTQRDIKQLKKVTYNINLQNLNNLFNDVYLLSYKCLLNISLYYKYITHSFYKKELKLTGEKHITSLGERRIILGETIFYQSPDSGMKEITPGFLMILRNKITEDDPINIEPLLEEEKKQTRYKIQFEEFTKDDEEVPEEVPEDIQEDDSHDYNPLANRLD